MFLVLAVVLIVVGYFAYVLIQYDRIDDKVSLDVLDNDKASDDAVTVGETYTIVTQNIGFGAYLQDFTFFMDGGTESWGRSKEEVIWAVNEAADKVKSLNPDFALIQEVDFYSTRSYHIKMMKYYQHVETMMCHTKKENIQTDFVYSDHNPVVMSFKLKD